MLASINQKVLAMLETLFRPWRPSFEPIILPEGHPSRPPTPEPELERLVMRTASRQAVWRELSMADKALLLKKCIDSTLSVVQAASKAAVEAKGSYGAGLGDELLTWVSVVSGLREYADTLDAEGHPAPVSLQQVHHSQEETQWKVKVFPRGWLESLIWAPFVGELVLQPGSQPEQGFPERKDVSSSGVGLVLGAGNQQNVVVLDILHMLVVENMVTIVKLNPVNEYIGEFLNAALEPLVSQGFVAFCYGGGKDVGSFLCMHPKVTRIHLTGSATTYDAISTKVGSERGSNHPVELTGELGCVTPYIIVPGPWSKTDLDYHAESIVAALSNNAGHNCVKAEIIVTDSQWALRDAFLDALRRKLAEQPTRVAYYPGSRQKYEDFKRQFPDCEEFGLDDHGRLPWRLKTGLSPDEADTHTEHWCGVLQEVCLSGCQGKPDVFLRHATRFANESCWGTLGCNITIHPKTEQQFASAYETALRELRYGSVAVNCPGLVAFSITKLGWGGYRPRKSNTCSHEETEGCPTTCGNSGNCIVHNTLLFKNVEKSVLKAPWRFHPHPVWSGQHRNSEALAYALLHCVGHPSMWQVGRVARHAILG